MIRTLMLLIAFSFQILNAQNSYVLLGTWTGTGSNGIYVYKLNSSTGDVKEVSFTEATDPSYMAISKDNSHVYAVNENRGSVGAVSAYSFDKAIGKLTLINTEPSNGQEPCYISIDPSGKWVAIANYTGGNFSVFKILPNGGLAPAAQTIQHTGKGPKENQEAPHVHCTLFSNDGKQLAVVDLGTDKVMLYNFDPSKDKPLDEKGISVSVKAGSGPRHIIFHPTKPFAYVIEEMAGNIEAYGYKNGKLTWLQTISSHPKGFNKGRGSAELRISPDGKFLYGSNREESNTIATFRINANGTLKTPVVQPSGGTHPRDFKIDPSGKFLLVANKNSGNVAIFRRNSKTGLLTDTGKKILLKEPVAVDFIDVK